MEYTRNKFEKRGFDVKEYQRYLRRHQAEYIRKRLYCVKLYSEKYNFDEIATALQLHHQTVRKHINIYLIGGFDLLCETIIREQKSRLDEPQSNEFKAILLTKRPFEVGLEGNIWTGAFMCEYLKNTYGIEYKSGIYDLLERLNLSHQKAHSDYSNAKPAEQIAYLNDLKETILAANEQTAIVKFDEFSISEKPIGPPTRFLLWLGREKHTPKSSH
jgi:transposase